MKHLAHVAVAIGDVCIRCTQLREKKRSTREEELPHERSNSPAIGKDWRRTEKALKSCRTYRTSKYGYGGLEKLTEWSGTEVLRNSQKFQVGTRRLYPYPYLYPFFFKGHTRTPGIVSRAYRTRRFLLGGLGYESRIYRTCRSSGTRVAPKMSGESAFTP